MTDQTPLGASPIDKAIDTLHEMICQRKYKICEKKENCFIGVNSDKKIIVFTNPVSKFNVDSVKEYIKISSGFGINHCIIVYTDSVTSMAKKLIENSVDIKIELFMSTELQFNITRHRLVPTHIKLDDVDAKKFKKQFGLKFPAILKTDPISRFYGYERGDIIKIIRPSDYIMYRIVKG